MTYFTIAQIKEANKSAGYHFFDRSSMRFFASRILRGIIGGKYFITSERFINGIHSEPRKYNVRWIDHDCRIQTHGEFQQYGTAQAARNAAKELARLDALKPRFSVVERSSFYEVIDNHTGQSHPMGDGVDTLFDADGNPINCGTEAFRLQWEEELNANASETLEAYFPETFRQEG